GGAGDIVGWTDISPQPLNVTQYTADWAVNFSALQTGGTNYVSVRTWKATGATATVTDAFFIRKDILVPGITDPAPGDDTVWRNANTGVYDVDFNDTPALNGSNLSKFQVRASTSSGGTGPFSPDWTDVLTLNATYYTTNWSLPTAVFTGLKEGQNYVSLRTYDGAGNTYSLTDAFFVRKDTTPPSITNNMGAGDTAWRRQNNGAYNVDFADTGGSQLARFEVKASTLPGGAGPFLFDFTTVVANINAASYTTDWALPGTLFNLLQGGTNYVSVRVFDAAGSTTAAVDAFKILKDTAAPVVSDSQSGDDAWRNAAGAAYNVSFADALSRLDTLQYAVWTGAGQTGTPVLSYTTIAGPNLGQPSYSTPWSVDFANLAAGTNYVSVRAWDTAGSTQTTVDVFYVKKDTSPPVVTDNQPGDELWRNADPGAAYNVDFQDPLSLLATVQYTVNSAAGLPSGTGDVIAWTNIVAPPLNQASHTADWALNFSLLHEGTNYVSVRAHDTLSQGTTVQDVFVVRKDTTPPTAQDNNSPNDTLTLSAPGTLYDVDFLDLGGAALDHAEYTVWTDPNFAGGQILPYTDIILSINATYYIEDWPVNFNALPNHATSYVSVRIYDNAGNAAVSTDVFKVIKEAQVPVISDNQSGDAVWRDQNDGTYDVDFQALSGQNLDKFQVRSSTKPGNAGPFTSDWTDVATAIGDTLYTTNWSLPSTVFEAMLNDATNYVSVRIYDLVPSSNTQADVFYVRKSTSGPTITDLQDGDTTYRSAAGTAYNVDFHDPGAGLQRADYT
ncbi:MAG TPA: hypothetical protein P5079_11615, partial [Elusimicrobiota bacterium]|nr:hypothetical protein [Elusimicrobiota bacterium]